MNSAVASETKYAGAELGNSDICGFPAMRDPNVRALIMRLEVVFGDTYWDLILQLTYGAKMHDAPRCQLVR